MTALAKNLVFLFGFWDWNFGISLQGYEFEHWSERGAIERPAAG